MVYIWVAHAILRDLEALLLDALRIGFISWRNSIYSVNFLSSPEELRYPMPSEHVKVTPKERRLYQRYI